MTNISAIQRNITQVAGISSLEIMRLTLLGITLTSFILFSYVMAVMLSVCFTSTVARQEVRYILFTHMLVTDLVYLLLSLFLFLAFFYPTKYPAPFCYIMVFVTSTSLKITPYNLAIMSLERYVAICFPLRHREICTLHRMGIAIAIIWVIALLPNVADFFVLILSVQKTFFSQNVVLICSRSSFIVTSVQNTIRLASHASTFSLVGLIIIFTYIKIMLVAFKVDSGKSSASKAGRTVMLHAIQLLLCMMAFSYSIFEIILKDYISLLPIINFCFFMCLPRFISPFIYGIRDKLFRKQIQKFIFCGFQKCSSK
ncbi:PREDICTED: olfactory receptor 52A1-like [Nanorana parkeri]|uniref:olfactory receptor 52A1-like n=1 Tax=Nanorana parkeri TaxID=125878 RepID=UPI00085457FA|nr:PREDICTED: olfactory receptor 52A1-like [Nanorana parkeri]